MKSKETHKQLIAAINLLGEYASKHLPADYEIVLTFSRDEASMDLVDPVGFDLDVQSPDCGYSTFAEACDIAKSLDDIASDYD